MDDGMLPTFSFTPEEIAAIKAEVGAVDIEPGQEIVDTERPAKRKPGRPRKNPEPEPEVNTSPELRDVRVPLTRREEKEVAARLANILGGITGMGGIVKPYIPMTDEEAQAIAEPLASYLIRNEPTSGVAREILENYDIVAMMLGVGAYGVRVYSDRKHELEANRPPNTTAIKRVSEIDESNNGRLPNEGVGSSEPYSISARSGINPTDL